MKIDLDIKLTCQITPTARAMQILGPYDRKPRSEIGHERTVAWTIPDDWNVLSIVGDSMSGKSTLARALCREIDGTMLEATEGHGGLAFQWPKDRSILDGFPDSAPCDDVAGMLTSVGFSSIPDFDKPFWALSAGGQFRVTLARALVETKLLGRPLVIDEFASLVDPVAAMAGSAALSKTARRENLKIVCVGWRRDHLPYLEPDSIWDCDRQRAIDCFDADGRRLVRRPPVELRLFRTDQTAWPLFRGHHYLDAGLHRQAQCFAATCQGQPAAFVAVQHFPSGTIGKTWREHRVVTLPKFQGLGIGMAVSEAVAGMFASTAVPYFSTTSHPGMIAHRRRHPERWRIVRNASMSMKTQEGLVSIGSGERKTSALRLTESHQYVGPADADGAKRLGVKKQ